MKIDIERIRRHVDTLAGFTATPGKGSTRLSYSREFRQACDYVATYARRIGLAVREDAVGNLRVRLQGGDANAPAIVVGSHLDTVPHGGDLDGALGVVCGLEVLDVLTAQDRSPVRSIELIGFVEEEGTSFRCPLAGSKAITGGFSTGELRRLIGASGQSMDEVAREFGLDPDLLGQDQLRQDNVAAMLELHIEQGAVLESLGIPIGVVSHIAGSDNYKVRFQGQANHAGTTPMELRRDALAGAAEAVLLIEDIASQRDRPHTVATVGRIDCLPNAVNVVPGSVEFGIDVRDIVQADIDSAATAIAAGVKAIAERRNLSWTMKLTGKSSPQPMCPEIVDMIDRLAARLQFPHHRMHSGALHDAAMLARVTRTGMIFVPSIAGKSHTPEEQTDYADIECGANLLLAAVRELAAA